MNDFQQGLLIVFIAIIIVAVGIPVFLAVRNRLYKNFVLEHSVALKRLKQINHKYNFISVPNYDYEHSYDNENFYGNISCQDYLIYQLVFEKFNVLSAMKDTLYNKELYKKYSKEIEDNCVMNIFDIEKRPSSERKLQKVEEQMFRETMLDPTINFLIMVKLNLTNINGYLRESKAQEFRPKEIRDLITYIDQKRGSYYTNSWIWEAICRVERGKVSNKLRFAIYQRDGYRCQRCHRKTNDLEIDHIIPIARGGKTEYSNLQTLCRRCNKMKGTNIEYY